MCYRHKEQMKSHQNNAASADNANWFISKIEAELNACIVELTQNLGFNSRLYLLYSRGVDLFPWEGIHAKNLKFNDLRICIVKQYTLIIIYNERLAVLIIYLTTKN